MLPLAIISSGMMTGVGLSAQASCAAIRCAIDGFKETRFIDRGGEWIIGCQVPLDQPWRGVARLIHMAVPAIEECLAGGPKIATEHIPLLLCAAEPNRPGRREGLDSVLFERILAGLGKRFHARSSVIAQGRASIGEAMLLSRKLIYEEGVPCCLIAGVDSLLVGPALIDFERKFRLLTSVNSDGFVPGEAAGAILVQAPAGPGTDPAGRQLLCLGIGVGREPATVDSEEPLRADGLVAAVRGAMAEAGRTLTDTDYRLADVNGSQYFFKEAALAMNRVLRDRKVLYEIWHPADCIGETGAAIGPCVLAVALAAAKKDYAAPVLAFCAISAGMMTDARR